MRIDLHCHSCCSDGSDTPAELMNKAAAAGLDVVAITDHDNTAGWAEASSSLPPGLTLVPGAEFSTQIIRPDGRPKGVHLLGYLFDPTDPTIVAEQSRIRTNREERGLAIVAKLIDAGVRITPEQVLDAAAGAPVGRPHIARVLCDTALVGSIQQAFDQYLELPQFKVAKANTDIDIAITMIKVAGGVSILAHPWSRGGDEVITPTKLRALQDVGLNGVEVNHPDHDRDARQGLSRIASELDLIVTGSSDYHGKNKLLLLGQETTSVESLDRIIAASSGVTVPVVAP